MGATRSGVWGGTQSGTANTSLALTAQTLTVGDFVIVGMFIRTAAGPVPTGVGITSSLGNTYTNMASVDGGTTIHSELWGGFVTVGGSETITWNWTGAGAASSTATAWGSVSGTTAANAIDVAVVTNQAVSANISTGASATTTVDKDLVVNYTGQQASPAWDTAAFSPAGNAFAVPDTQFQTTGTDNNNSGMSSIQAGVSGATQSFTMHSSSGAQWISFLAVLKTLGGQDISAGPSVDGRVRMANRNTGPRVLRFYYRQPRTNWTISGPVLNFLNLSTVLGFTNTLPKLTSRLLAISLGFTTSLQNLTKHLFAGVPLGFTTTISKTTSRALPVSLGFVTAINKVTSRGLAVSLGFITSTPKLLSRALSTTLGFATAETIQGPIQVSAVDVSSVGVCSPSLSNVAAGNLVVACIDTAGVAFTAPAGWLLAVEGTGTNIKADIWYLAGNVNLGGTINPTFTSGAAAGVRGFLSEWKGVDPFAPVTATAHSTASSSLTCASGTLSGNNATDVAITCFGEKVTSATSTFTPGANYTQLATFNHGGNATNHIVGDYRLNAPVGDSETETSNLTSDTNGWASAIATFRGRQRFIKLPIKSLIVSLGLTTSLVKQTARTFAISLGFTPSIQKLISRVQNVSLGFTTSISKNLSRSLSVSLGFVTSLPKQSVRAFSVSLGFTTSITKRIGKALAVALGFVSAFNAKKLGITLVNFSVSLGFATTHTSSRLFRKAITASMKAVSTINPIHWYSGVLRASASGQFRAISRALKFITKGRFNS